MTATPALTTDLKHEVLRLEDDLRARIDGDAEVKGRWVLEHKQALHSGRTAAAWVAWRDGWVTQAAVAWVLTTVFVRFCEDNGLLSSVWIAGPELRRQEALDAQLAFFRQHPEDTDREWLEQAVHHLAAFPATAALVDRHSALQLVTPSGEAASGLLAFWRRRGDDGALIHDLTDSTLSTRFLGDMYQDLSEYAKKTFALLQTPEFVEEFILDRTLEPALAERPLEGFRLIDPACGSGHFLLGGFKRLLDRWDRHAPGLELQARVQEALDAIHGVDLNPFAAAISRFRLTVAALDACGLKSLEHAPAFRFHVAAGDSLLHGSELNDRAEANSSGFAYLTEDPVVLDEILADGRYDVVVGNPPYPPAKDRQLNKAYRKLYKTCSGKYALTVPFMERFFGLARTPKDGRSAGWVGQITSNSFMKREFGSKIVENFLVHKDLRLVADTSGAYIPGHGTPTVIIVGRPTPSVGTSIRAVLGVRGEVGVPEDPAKGNVWTSIIEHVNEPGYEDRHVTVVDLEREWLSRHPWILAGGGAIDLLKRLDTIKICRLRDQISDFGIVAVTGEDDFFMLPDNGAAARIGWLNTRPLVEGELVRDWVIAGSPAPTAWTYDSDYKVRPLAELGAFGRWATVYKPALDRRKRFGVLMVRRGFSWYEWQELYSTKLRTPLSITFAFVATHNHFVLDRGGKVFKQSAPVIKLPEGATEDEHLALLGVLNSSTACFWLKQNSHNKGSTVDSNGARQTQAPWEDFYEFTGTTLQDYPLSSVLPLDRGRLLDLLSQDLTTFAPAAVAAAAVPVTEVMVEARAESERLRGRMVAVQEDLDWEVYRLYGLIEDDLTYAGIDLPGLVLGERAFEIALARAVEAGEETTEWFARHRSTPITEVPSNWPAAYRDLVERRLELITSDPAIRLLERPEYKRRWASEPWDKRQTEALRVWLLDRLEARRFWFDAQGRPAPSSVARLADDVARDPDLVSVLALWEGRPDVPVVKSLVALLADEVVPYLAAYRYKDPGLRKRGAWEETWALQRREDAGEDLGVIAVPPKYAPADFRKTSYWQARGKLDVPKERFILYPAAGREMDSTPLLGWAGWDHAQQSLAISTIITDREAEGWRDDQLVPLVAGLAELQPWVEQWHGEVDPTYGVSLAAFCREQLTERMAQVGKSLDELSAWRPAPATRGRQSRAKAVAR